MRWVTQPDAGSSTTWGELIAQRARAYADAVARVIAYPVVTPNTLTVLGFVLTLGVAMVIGRGYLFVGGLLVIVVGLFDMLDGAMARVSGLKTRFGGFLDSTLDRASEAALLGGVLWAHPERETALIVLWVLAGSLLVSYTRARGGEEGVKAEVGWLPRPQRVVLLAAGLITGLVIPALWILAVFTTVTTIQRILHVRKALGDR